MVTGQQCPICGTERTRAGTLPCSCARQNPAPSTDAYEVRHAGEAYKGSGGSDAPKSAMASAERGAISATPAHTAGWDDAGRSEGTSEIGGTRDDGAVQDERHTEGGGPAVDGGFAAARGSDGPGSSASAPALGGPRDHTGGTDDFEPLRLRPYVSLPDADDHAVQASASASATHEPDGGLLGPNGPLSWSLVEEIWGPNERTKRSDSSDVAVGSHASPAAGTEDASAPAGEPDAPRGTAASRTAPDGTEAAGRTGEAARTGAPGPRRAPEPDSGVSDWPGRPDGPQLNGAQLEGTAPPGSTAGASAAPAESTTFESPRRSDFFGTQHPFGRSPSPDDDDRGTRARGGHGAAALNGADAADGTDVNGTDGVDGRSPAAGNPTGRTAAVEARAGGAHVGDGREETGGDRAAAKSYDPHAPYDAHEPDSASDPDEPTAYGARRRQLTVLVASCVAVAVTVVALIVSGVFSYQKPSRDNTALPGTDASTSAPDRSATDPSSSRPEADAPPASHRPSAPHTAGQAPGGAPAPSAPPPEPSTPPTTGGGGATGGTPPPNKPPVPPVLQPGDKGAEVKELQLRLRQLLLYLGLANGQYSTGLETAVGNYQESRGIKNDKPGVYGLATRHKLESETRTP